MQTKKGVEITFELFSANNKGWKIPVSDRFLLFLAESQLLVFNWKLSCYVKIVREFKSDAQLSKNSEIYILPSIQISDADVLYGSAVV